MQVNMISLSNVPETSVKQDSKPISDDNSFKAAVTSTIQKSNENSASDKSQVKTSSPVEPGEEVQGEDKQKKDSKNTDENLSILFSQLLNGKINFSDLTTSLKNEIQGLIKANINVDGVSDKKLSDAVANLFNNLLSGKEKMSTGNLADLTTDQIKSSLSQFDSQIVNLLKDTAAPENINDNSVMQMLDQINKSLLSGLNTEASGTNAANTERDYNNILFALKTKLNFDKSKTKNETLMGNLNSGVNDGSAKDTYKISTSNVLQNPSEASVNIDKRGQSNSNAGSKKQDLDNSDGYGFLKNLISGDKDNKVSKLSTFMAQFNSIKSDAPVSNGENITVNQANFTNDMIKTVKYMESNNIKDLTVKITPKELGEVTIKLTMENGVMKASLTASNKDAYNLLSSNMKDISDKLQDSNIKIQNFDINVYEDTTFFKDSSNNQSREQYKGNKSANSIKGISDEESDETVTPSLDNSALNALV